MGHREGDVLPVAIRENVLLRCDPLLSGLHTAGAAGLRLAALTEKTGMGASGRSTAVATNAQGTGAAGEHALHGKCRPFAEVACVFFEVSVPSIIVLKQQLCGARDMHSAEYKTRQGKVKILWLQGSHAHASGVLLFKSSLTVWRGRAKPVNG